MSKKEGWGGTRSIYIAGPMSGYPGFNFPAFYAAEEYLKEEGWVVYNPANKEDEDALNDEAFETGDSVKAIEEGFDFRKVYLWDIEKVIAASAILMLPGWEASPGARGEHAVACAIKKHYPGYQIFYGEVPERVRYRKAA